MTRSLEHLSSCPRCGETNMRTVSKSGDKFDGEQVVICMNCSLVFLNPRTVEIEDYYTSNEFSRDFRGSVKPDKVKLRADRMRAKIRWDFLEKYLDKQVKLLEIGFGSGMFLKIAQDHLPEVCGIDASTSYADYAREDLGMNVVSGLFPDDVPERYLRNLDTIVLFHTLEHVRHPQRMLDNISDALPKDGIFIIEYPDISRALERSSFVPQTYFQRSHLYDFNFTLIVRMLAESGLWVVGSFLDTNYPRDKNILLICKRGAKEDRKYQMNTHAEELYARLKKVIG